jgi:hypothetical protein
MIKGLVYFQGFVGRRRQVTRPKSPINGTSSNATFPFVAQPECWTMSQH